MLIAVRNLRLLNLANSCGVRGCASPFDCVVLIISERVGVELRRLRRLFGLEVRLFFKAVNLGGDDRRKLPRAVL